MKTTALVSPRLSFRPLRLGDEVITFPHIDDELTKHWIGWEKAETIEEERQRLVRIIEHSSNTYFVVFDRANNFIGMCGLVPEDSDCVELSVDVWVVKEAQRNGYGLEMVRALITWARTYTREKYLIYSVTEGNVASRKMAEHLGLGILKTFSAQKRGVARIVTDFKIALR